VPAHHLLRGHRARPADAAAGVHAKRGRHDFMARPVSTPAIPLVSRQEHLLVDSGAAAHHDASTPTGRPAGSHADVVEQLHRPPLLSQLSAQGHLRLALGRHDRVGAPEHHTTHGARHRHGVQIGRRHTTPIPLPLAASPPPLGLTWSTRRTVVGHGTRPRRCC
jgi:hypothetical protein